MPECREPRFVPEDRSRLHFSDLRSVRSSFPSREEKRLATVCVVFLSGVNGYAGRPMPSALPVLSG